MELKEINANKETLRKNLLDLIELQHILKKTQVFFQEVKSLPSLLPLLSPFPPWSLNRRRLRACALDVTAG